MFLRIHKSLISSTFYFPTHALNEHACFSLLMNCKQVCHVSLISNTLTDSYHVYFMSNTSIKHAYMCMHIQYISYKSQANHLMFLIFIK